MTAENEAGGATPAVRLDRASAPAGTVVSAIANGFAPGEYLHLSVVGARGVVVRSLGRTDGDGTAAIAFAVPVAGPGGYGVLIAGNASRHARTDFELIAPDAPGHLAQSGPIEQLCARGGVPEPATVDEVSPVVTAPTIEAAVGLADAAQLEPVVAPVVGPPERLLAPVVGPVERAVEAVVGPADVASPPEHALGGPVLHAVPPDLASPGPGLTLPVPALPRRAVPAPLLPSTARARRATDGGRPRPRVLVGVVLAGVVFGGGLLGASGLPAPPPSAVVAQPANAAGTRLAGVAAPSPRTGVPAKEADELGSGTAVTLAFGGDVHFEDALARRLAANPRTVLDAARPLYAGADITMVNLETAVTTRGKAEPKQFTFRAPPSAYNALKAAGITLATQANNHGEDYGPDGLVDSIEDAKLAGFPVIGIGHNVAEAFAPYRATVAGQRIAIVAATQVLDDNLEEDWTATDAHAGLASANDTAYLLAAVRQARATSDTVVVYLHWGTELQSCPNPRQAPLAGQLVEAGADIVVGSHAHVQLGGGRLGRALVDYGLGNFAFYAKSGAGLESGVLRVTVTGRRIDSYHWVPARISAGVPRPLRGSAATAAQTRWANHRSCTDLAA